MKSSHHYTLINFSRKKIFISFLSLIFGFSTFNQTQAAVSTPQALQILKDYFIEKIEEQELLILKHSAGELIGDTVKISFQATELTEAVISYKSDGGNTMYSTPEKSFSHSSHIQELQNIEKGKRYSYLILVRDKSGEYAYAKGTFGAEDNTQENITKSTGFRVISDTVKSITDNSVKIVFESSDFSQAYIEYGTTTDYGSTGAKETSYKWKTHIQTLTDLRPGTKYHYKIHIKDKNGNDAVTQGNFTTTEYSQNTSIERTYVPKESTGKYPTSGKWKSLSDDLKNSNAPKSGSTVKEQFGTTTLKLPTDLSHSYSKRSAWNIDDSLLMLGGKIVDGSNHKILRSIPVASERVWSNTNPDIIYGFTYNTGKFQKVNAQTGDTTLIRDFGQYGSKCTIGDFEGGISNDDQFILFRCGNTLVSYNIKTNSVLGTLPTKSDFNWGGFSQSGKYVLIDNGQCVNGVCEVGEIVRYDKNLKNGAKLYGKSNHGDFGIDHNGDDVYVMIGWNYIFSLRIKDGKLTDLAGKPASHGHISCRNIYRPGYCYFSSNAGSIGSVNLKNGDIEYFGFHRSPSKEYKLQPKASVNTRGTKVIFTSNWNGKSGINDFIVSSE